MKESDQSLQKLLDAAAQARSELPETPPFAVEAAIIAQMRSSPRDDEFATLLWLFRRATIFAVLVMTLSGAWHHFATKNSAGATALANYAMMQLPP